MNEYRMEHIFTLDATVEAPEVIGPVADGLRLNAYISGGSLSGPRLNGTLRPVGADWLRVRTDGVGLVDARTTFELDDGALIYAQYTGVCDLGEAAYESLLAGRFPGPATVRAAGKLHCAAPAHGWINRHQFVVIGAGDFGELRVRHDFYALA